MKGRILKILFHSLGFSSIFGAILFADLTFIEMLLYGRSVSVESNFVILVAETVLAFFALVYFVYLFYTFSRR